MPPVPVARPLPSHIRPPPPNPTPASQDHSSTHSESTACLLKAPPPSLPANPPQYAHPQGPITTPSFIPPPDFKWPITSTAPVNSPDSRLFRLTPADGVLTQLVRDLSNTSHDKPFDSSQDGAGSLSYRHNGQTYSVLDHSVTSEHTYPTELNTDAAVHAGHEHRYPDSTSWRCNGAASLEQVPTLQGCTHFTDNAEQQSAWLTEQHNHGAFTAVTALTQQQQRLLASMTPTTPASCSTHDTTDLDGLVTVASQRAAQCSTYEGTHLDDIIAVASHHTAPPVLPDSHHWPIHTSLHSQQLSYLSSTPPAHTQTAYASSFLPPPISSTSPALPTTSSPLSSLYQAASIDDLLTAYEGVRSNGTLDPHSALTFLQRSVRILCQQLHCSMPTVPQPLQPAVRHAVETALTAAAASQQQAQGCISSTSSSHTADLAAPPGPTSALHHAQEDISSTHQDASSTSSSLMPDLPAPPAPTPEPNHTQADIRTQPAAPGAAAGVSRQSSVQFGNSPSSYTAGAGVADACGTAGQSVSNACSGYTVRQLVQLLWCLVKLRSCEDCRAGLVQLRPVFVNSRWRLAKELRSSTIIRLAWSASKAYRQASLPLWQDMHSSLSPSLPSLTPTDLATLLTALAHAAPNASPLVSPTLSEAANRGPHAFTAREVTNITWAAAKLGCFDDLNHHHDTNNSHHNTDGHSSGQNVHDLNQHHDTNNSHHTTDGHSSEQSVDECTEDPGGVLRESWSGFRSGVSEDGLVWLEQVCGWIPKHRRELGPQGVSNLLWALGRAGHYDEGALKVLSRQAQRLIWRLSPQGLSNCLWSLTHLRFHNPQTPHLHKAAVKYFLSQPHVFSPLALATLIHTFSLAGCHHPQMVQAAAAVAVERMHQFHGETLVKLMVGLAGMQCSVPLTFLQAATPRLLSAIQSGSLPPRSLLYALTAILCITWHQRHQGNQSPVQSTTIHPSTEPDTPNFEPHLATDSTANPCHQHGPSFANCSGTVGEADLPSYALTNRTKPADGPAWSSTVESSFSTYTSTSEAPSSLQTNISQVQYITPHSSTHLKVPPHSSYGLPLPLSCRWQAPDPPPQQRKRRKGTHLAPPSSSCTPDTSLDVRFPWSASIPDPVQDYRSAVAASSSSSSSSDTRCRVSQDACGSEPNEWQRPVWKRSVQFVIRDESWGSLFEDLLASTTTWNSSPRSSEQMLLSRSTYLDASPTLEGTHPAYTNTAHLVRDALRSDPGGRISNRIDFLGGATSGASHTLIEHARCGATADASNTPAHHLGQDANAGDPNREVGESTDHCRPTNAITTGHVHTEQQHVKRPDVPEASCRLSDSAASRLFVSAKRDDLPSDLVHQLKLLFNSGLSTLTADCSSLLSSDVVLFSWVCASSRSWHEHPCRTHEAVQVAVSCVGPRHVQQMNMRQLSYWVFSLAACGVAHEASFRQGCRCLSGMSEQQSLAMPRHVLQMVLGLRMMTMIAQQSGGDDAGQDHVLQVAETRIKSEVAGVDGLS